MSDLTDAIEQNASGPKQVTVDGQTVVQHSIPDVIAADEYVERKRASNRSTLPVRLFKISPGGAP